MVIHLSPIGETELSVLLPKRASFSTQHSLTTDPAAADLILLTGSFGISPQLLLDHPLFRAYPDHCAVYTEDDNYLPLGPGVYCSAHIDSHSRAGRTFSYSYVSSAGIYSNPFVTTSDSATAGNEKGPKSFLFSFQGGSTSLLRKKLFNLTFRPPSNGLSILMENTSSYYHWDLERSGREQSQRTYAETISASHFVLSPRGAGAGSIRLFEVMAAGVAPVLISDAYLLPLHINWDSFLLRIPEKDIARLPEILDSHLASAAERGRLARKAWLEHFAPAKEFDAIVSLCVAALNHGPPSESTFRQQQSKIISRANRRRKFRSLTRNAVLNLLRILHLKNPYQMNR